MSQRRPLRTLTDEPALAAALRSHGLEAAAAAQKAALVARAAGSLLSVGADPAAPARVWLVPGRVEVLGKHTDYAGGRSLIAAVERGFCMLAQGLAGPQVHVLSADLGEQALFDLSADLSPQTGHWTNYPMTVARRLARNFPQSRRGAMLAVSSDLPAAAGVSSSSAFVVAMFLALSAVNDLPASEPYRRNVDSPEALSEYLGTVENGRGFRQLAGDRGVGTFGGSEDHTAILCCRAGMLSQYGFCPLRLERCIALPDDLALGIASSGVRAEKTRGTREKFNRASYLASAVVEAWNRATGRADATMGDMLAAAGPQGAGRIRQVLDGDAGEGPFPAAELLRRFEHFHAENEQIIPAAGDALAAGDLEAFGRLVERSQRGAEQLLGNQVDETIFLARSAGQCGALAASAFGAGFGGSVWALFRRPRAEEQLAAWRAAYRQAFPAVADHANFFLTRPGPAAFELD